MFLKSVCMLFLFMRILCTTKSVPKKSYKKKHGYDLLVRVHISLLLKHFVH